MNSEFSYILLVEDDENDKDFFVEALKDIKPSFAWHWAKNGTEALAILTSHRYHLPECIFMDINMPLMGGIECLKRIKADAALRDIPIIMLSTAIDSRTRTAAEAAGAISCAIKPTTNGQLVKILSFYLTPILNSRHV